MSRHDITEADIDPTLKLALTTARCSEIIAHLIERRNWSVARIARVIDSSVEYVQRIQAKKQSFQVSDVEALAKACRLKPHMLLFESMRREKFKPELRGLYDLLSDEVQRHKEFQRALHSRTKGRRRPAVKAA